ncbi:MAG: methionine adenosyltransferase [Candidatus Methylomirabilales bacterium]
MDDIHIQPRGGLTVGELDVEIVERKGLGHPDTICDAVMERVSQALSRAYMERFGGILHHNCDKGLLVAGRVERRFGGGRVLEPMRLVIGDRATATVGNKEIDVVDIAVETAKSWFRENLRRVDPDRHLTYQVELKPGSEELTGLFMESRGVLGANDTSAAVGYAPLSETEEVVLETERFLNSSAFKARFPETGEDVKVMGVRTGRRLAVTISMPLLDEYVEHEGDYFRRKQAVHEALLVHLRGRLHRLQDVTVSLNTLDRRGAGMAGMYLSVLGTSAEDADSGEVGRGNQVNGLIALNRPRGSEAAAGKNPVSHVGKIYNILSHLLAARIHTEVPGLQEVVVWLCSRIGEPVDRPQMVSVQVHLQPRVVLADVTDPIQRVVKEALARMPVFCEELARGHYPIC